MRCGVPLYRLPHPQFKEQNSGQSLAQGTKKCPGGVEMPGSENFVVNSHIIPCACMKPSVLVARGLNKATHSSNG